MEGYSQKNSVQLIKNGHEFIELNIELIRSAQESILLHTYIFEDDEVTKYIIDALLFSASKGVQIYIIVDAVGSADLGTKTIDELLKSGINFSIFKPILSLENIGRRLHQKVLLIDGQKCLLGGINLSKTYNSPTSGTPWLDYSCLFEGNEIPRLISKITPLYKKQFPLFQSSLTFPEINHGDHYPQCKVRVIVNDWLKRQQEIYNTYLSRIQEAETEIYILATYFLPGKKLLKALKEARKRGVNIHLYFGSNTDQKLAAKASSYFFNWYVAQGINVYEWDKSIVHGKIALIDDNWVTIGSYNHNFISRYGNSEINIEIINKNFARIVYDEFCKIQEGSKKIEKSYLDKKSGLNEKLTLFLTYVLLNILTFLSLVFIYKQDRLKK